MAAESKESASKLFRTITRACCSSGVSASEWVKLVETEFKLGESRERRKTGHAGLSRKELSKAFAASLLAILCSTQPVSLRLLSYYRAALNCSCLIRAGDAAEQLLKSIDKLNNIPALAGSCPNNIPQDHADLVTINALSLPLLNSFPNPADSLQTADPAQALARLNSLLVLFNRASLAPPSTGTTPPPPPPALKLGQILLNSLASSILTIPTSAFLNLPLQLDPSLHKLESLILHPLPPPHPSATHSELLSTILRHLSPSLAKKIAFEAAASLTTAQPSPNDPRHFAPSFRACSIIAHSLLSPGASALPQNTGPTPLLTSIITLASSDPKTRPLNSPNPQRPGSIPPPSWIFDLFLAACRIASPPCPATADADTQAPASVSPVEADEQDSEDDKVCWKTLLGGGRLAELVRAALDNPALQPQHKLLLTAPELVLLRHDLLGRSPSHPPRDVDGDASMDSNPHEQRGASRQLLWAALLASICANQLVAPDELERAQAQGELDTVPGHHSMLELGLEPIADCLGKPKETGILELALTIKQTVHTAAASFDLSLCVSLAKALTRLDTLCTLFLWLEPRDVLAPITGLLDHWGSAGPGTNDKHMSNESDGSSEFEKFGCLLGWVQGVVGRLGLMGSLDKHLDTRKGFTLHYLLNPSTAYPLNTLPPTHAATLSSWLEALFGSSGISDELLIKTDPRVFFELCPSLCKQAFDGLRAGILDRDAFREGLSYFEQELLLGGAAVGIVGWLVNELSRIGAVPSTAVHTALLEILEAILLSDAISPTVIHLVASKCLRLVRTFGAHLAACPPSDGRGVHINVTRLELKLTAEPACGPVCPTGFLSGSAAREEGWADALTDALRDAVCTGTPGGTLWSLLPHVLGAASPAAFVRTVMAGLASVAVRQDGCWDAAQYIRLEQAAAVGVEVLMWPYEQGGEGIGRVLEEVFSGWAVRVVETQEVAHAELEREILKECLARIGELESVSGGQGGLVKRWTEVACAGVKRAWESEVLRNKKKKKKHEGADVQRNEDRERGVLRWVVEKLEDL